MITVCLNKDDFTYDIHSLVKAFYAREEVKVSADQEKIKRLEQEHTPLLHMEISYLEKSGFKPEETEKDRIEIGLYLPQKKLETVGNPAAFQGTASQADGYTAKDGAVFQGTASQADGHAAKDGAISQKLAYGADGYTLADQAAVQTDFSDRKMTKDRLKQSLYRMLSEFTGQKLPWGSLTGIRPVKIAMSMLEQGKEEEEIKAYMADTYFASGQKIGLCIEIAKQEQRMLSQIDYKDGCSLYVGIPFCPSICSYCSFSSSPIGKWQGQVERYLDALKQELAFASAFFAGKKLNTIYIGGGTPTTLSPEQLDWLLAEIEASVPFKDLMEYTVEAGRPDSITREKLMVMREHGISRISINPQTMKQETLELIGRRHTTVQTIESFWLARELGFDNINMDLILGLPEETLEDVRNTMEQIKGLSPDNLTVHSLAIKRAARFQTKSQDYQGMRMKNSWETVDLTAEYARGMGMLPYYLYRQKNIAGNFENVGYAKPGKEGLYNILMMEEKQSIVACGAGSVSKRVYPDGRIERSENVKDVALYIQKIDEMIERKRKLLMDF